MAEIKHYHVKCSTVHLSDDGLTASVHLLTLDDAPVVLSMKPQHLKRLRDNIDRELDAEQPQPQQE